MHSVDNTFCIVPSDVLLKKQNEEGIMLTSGAVSLYGAPSLLVANEVNGDIEYVNHHSCFPRRGDEAATVL